MDRGNMDALELFKARLPLKPYCTEDLDCGLKIRPAKSATQFPYIQPNTPTTIGWLVFDMDHDYPYSSMLRYFDVNFPDATIIAKNQDNGHCHVFYAIATPVFASPGHLGPLKFLAAIQEAIRIKLDADAGYCGLIAKNPLHSRWHILTHSAAVYDLAYLADWLDLAPAKNPAKSPQKAADTGSQHQTEKIVRLFE